MHALGQVERYLIHEFIEDYDDGLLSRRGMVRRVIGITGGVAATAIVLTSFGVTPVSRADAQEAIQTSNEPKSPLSVPEDNPRVVGEEVSFEGNGTTLMAYQAKPAAGSGPLPLVLVCHENRSLTAHIRDVARRWAVEGYLAVAVDLLSREGGTAAIADPADAPGLLTSGVEMSRHVDDFRATLDHYLAMTDLVDGEKIGMNGFCFGGAVTWRSATRFPELKAAAPFYGPPPPLEGVPKIKAAVHGVYSDDPGDGANEGLEDLRAALDESGITYVIKMYPGTQHAFHNDTGQRYNAEQAAAAWSDTIAWFAWYVLGQTSATPTA
jgi:carboxymethylenebutenolidase